MSGMLVVVTHEIKHVSAYGEAASARKWLLIRQHDDGPHEEVLRCILKRMHAEALPIANDTASQIGLDRKLTTAGQRARTQMSSSRVARLYFSRSGGRTLD